MRLRKVVNRVYHGTVYYRWIVSVPPRDVRALGWVDGQELETHVRGGTLVLLPTTRRRGGRREGDARSLEDAVRQRTLPQSERS
jgi:antitoxin component of MazEF toxin-antitoxin module